MIRSTLVLGLALGMSTMGLAAATADAGVPGHLDEAFGFLGTTTTAFSKESDVAAAIAVQSDGKIVVAGNTSKKVALARYTADGVPDESFGKKGLVVTKIGQDAGANAVAVQPDGKIVVAGFASMKKDDQDFALVRYNADGRPDAAFGTDGVAVNDLGTPADLVRGIALQTDGKILVSGDSGAALAAARYDGNGALDSSFGGKGTVTTKIGESARGYAVAVQADGKVVVAGSQIDPAEGINYAVVRYTAEGAPDTGFGKDGVVTTSFGSPIDVGHAVALQSDGKIVVAGRSGKSVGLVRYLADGSLDQEFSSDGTVTTAVGSSAKAESVALQADGKIVVAGSEVSEAQGTNFLVARYGADGKLDTGFGSGGVSTANFGSPHDEGEAMALQADGKIVVAGTTKHPVLGVSFGVARFLP